MADAQRSSANAIAATGSRVWIKRVIFPGEFEEEQFWVEASTEGVARVGNGFIQQLLDSGEAIILRPGATGSYPTEVDRG